MARNYYLARQRRLELPSNVNVVQFAKHRAKELARLTACIEETKGNKRIFQQLPHHMRRRAQSHNVKRVPRRIRELHMHQIAKSGKKKQLKRLTRRQKRRPRNLLDKYNQRQRKFVWLETHLWHAKRFQMSSQWGYKIPLHPRDKTLRACYKGVTQTAYLQDLSYYVCIEIAGVRSKIIEVLAQMTSPECGLTFNAVHYAGGQFEGSVVMYHCNKYPFDAIGSVKFMWRPPNNDKETSEVATNATDEDSCLWIWCHPSCHQELLAELVSAFKLDLAASPVGSGLVNGDLGAVHDDDSTKRVADETISPVDLLNDKAVQKLAPRLREFCEGTSWYRGKDVTLRLEDSLVRFRLVGQLSTVILVDAVREASLVTIESGKGDKVRWWQSLGKSTLEAHSSQCALWDDIRKSPFASCLPSNCVVALIAQDPRQNLSVSRSKVMPNCPDMCEPRFLPLRLPVNTCHSPLWHQSVRTAVMVGRLSDHEMNERRSSLLVPGTPLCLGNDGSRVPIICVHNSGSQTSDVSANIGVGWDLILPAGWGMAFWIALVYRNARVGGYDEGIKLMHGMGKPCFPEDYPDTAAGRSLESLKRSILTEKYFKYPPNKRPNYIKLGVVAPFHSPWSLLLSEWSTSDGKATDVDSQFFVLRDRKMLKTLRDACKLNHSFKKRMHAALDLVKVRASLDAVLLRQSSLKRCLVGIRLKMCSKGNVSEFALVCAPRREDLQWSNDDDDGARPYLVEPPHHDTTKSKRDKLRKDLKARRQKKSKKDKPEETENPLEKEVREKLGVPSATAAATRQDFNELLLPEVTKVRASCIREVIGFVKSGRFSLVEGRVTALAFVTLPSLLSVLWNAQADNEAPFVLVRLVNSSQYRFASISDMMWWQ